MILCCDCYVLALLLISPVWILFTTVCWVVMPCCFGVLVLFVAFGVFSLLLLCCVCDVVGRVVVGLCVFAVFVDVCWYVLLCYGVCCFAC